MDDLNQENDIHEPESLVLDEGSKRTVMWQPKDISIRELMTMYEDGDLNIQPSYQRYFVATPVIASRLVESVLMSVPLPVIYLAEEANNSYSVIDGQQRLTSLMSFIRGKFPDGKDFSLSGLTVYEDLNHKTFKELSKEQQKQIRNTTLHVIVIKKESVEDIKFDVFERLNTGSIQLNEDEVRNSVYRGNYIDLLAELEKSPTFHELVQRENLKKRMGYRGMILRFLALAEKTPIHYRPSMKQFCNRELKENRFLSEEKQQIYRERFEHCVDLVKTVFGKQAFRRYSLDEQGHGSWSASVISMSLFDVQMLGFLHYHKKDVLKNADAIREAMLALMTQNDDFIKSISVSTSNNKVLNKRCCIWAETLKNIIENTDEYQQRTFSYHIKEQLFKQNPVCALSGQRILAIEDAEVDHIIPYAKGGKTTLENAQLVLRYFNRAKRDNMNYQID